MKDRQNSELSSTNEEDSLKMPLEKLFVMCEALGVLLVLQVMT